MSLSDSLSYNFFVKLASVVLAFLKFFFKWQDMHRQFWLFYDVSDKYCSSESGHCQPYFYFCLYFLKIWFVIWMSYRDETLLKWVLSIPYKIFCQSEIALEKCHFGRSELHSNSILSRITFLHIRHIHLW